MNHYLLGLIFCTLVTGTYGFGRRVGNDKRAQQLEVSNQQLEADIKAIDAQINAYNEEVNAILGFPAGTTAATRATTAATTPSSAASVRKTLGQASTLTTTTGKGAKTGPVAGTPASIGNLQQQAQKFKTSLETIGKQMASLTAISDVQAEAFGRMIKHLSDMSAAQQNYGFHAIAFNVKDELINDVVNLPLTTADLKPLPKITATATVNGTIVTRENKAQKRARDHTTDANWKSLLEFVKNAANFKTGSTYNFEDEWFGTGKPLNTSNTLNNFQALSSLHTIKKDYVAAMNTLGTAADPTDKDFGTALDAVINACEELVNDEARASNTFKFTQERYDDLADKLEARATVLDYTKTHAGTEPATYDAYWRAVNSARGSYERALDIYLGRFQEALDQEVASSTCTGLVRDTAGDAIGFRPNTELLLHLNALICDTVTEIAKFDLMMIDNLMLDYAQGQVVADYTANPALMPQDCVLATFKDGTAAAARNWTFWARNTSTGAAGPVATVTPISRGDTDGFATVIDALQNLKPFAPNNLYPKL